MACSPRPPPVFLEEDSEHVVDVNSSEREKIKGKRRTSWVWAEFEFQIDKDERKVVCKHCKHKPSAKTSY